MLTHPDTNKDPKNEGYFIQASQIFYYIWELITYTFNHVNHAMMEIFMCIYLTVKFDGKQNGLLPELCIKMVQFGAGIGNITYCIYIYISEALMDHYFIWIHICCIWRANIPYCMNCDKMKIMKIMKII